MATGKGGVRLKNQLDSQMSVGSGATGGGNHSQTVQTDKSPHDYVNQVTINVQEGEDIGQESYEGSSIQGAASGSQT